MTKYRYQVRSRCLNPLVQKPSEWVTHSWHMTKEGAERELAWQKQHGFDGVLCEARIFEI